MGSGGKQGKRGKRGKTGWRGIAQFSHPKPIFERFCPFFAAYCDFVSVFQFLDRLGMVFSNLAFWPSKTLFFGYQLGLAFLSLINVV